jgi:hypothetical protein
MLLLLLLLLLARCEGGPAALSTRCAAAAAAAAAVVAAATDMIYCAPPVLYSCQPCMSMYRLSNALHRRTLCQLENRHSIWPQPRRDTAPARTTSPRSTLTLQQVPHVSRWPLCQPQSRQGHIDIYIRSVRLTGRWRWQVRWLVRRQTTRRGSARNRPADCLAAVIEENDSDGTIRQVFRPHLQRAVPCGTRVQPPPLIGEGIFCSTPPRTHECRDCQLTRTVGCRQTEGKKVD